MTTPATPVIAGVVVDEAGHPLADVAVALADAPGPVPDIAALTGSDGRFVIAAPLPGGYTILATAPGAASVSLSLHVDPGAPETSVEIRIPETTAPAGE